MRQAAIAGVSLPAIPIQATTDKVMRIERIQPPVAAGLIRFRPEQKVLLDQFRQFPNGAHDDGPDCCEMLWTNAVHHAGASLRSGLKVGAVRPTATKFEGFRMS